MTQIPAFRMTSVACSIVALTAIFIHPAGGSAHESAAPSGMRVILTGSGSAFPDPFRGGASVAVVIDQTVLQFDFGRRVMDNQMRAGINPMDVDYVFLTHLHFDHIATYSYFVISDWIAGRQRPVHVYGPEGTVAMHQGAVRYEHAADYAYVKFMLKNWLDTLPFKPTEEPPFLVQDAQPGVVVETPVFKVTAVATPHYETPGLHSLAYRVDTRYGSVVISGDTAACECVARLAKGADLLIHEMMKPDPGMVEGGKFSESRFDKPRSDRPQTGHTGPTELGRLAAQAGVKTLVATHLAPYTSVTAAIDMQAPYVGTPGKRIWADMIYAIRKQFNGAVILAEDGMEFSLP